MPSQAIKDRNEEIRRARSMTPTSANPVIKNPSPITAIADPMKAGTALRESNISNITPVTTRTGQDTGFVERIDDQGTAGRINTAPTQREEFVRQPIVSAEERDRKLSEERRFGASLAESGLTNEDLIRLTGLEDADAARNLLRTREGLSAQDNLDLNERLEQTKFDIAERGEEERLLSEEDKIRADLEKSFAPRREAAAREAGQARETALRVQGRAGMGSKSETQQQGLVEKERMISDAISAEQQIQERMLLAEARGASAEQMEFLGNALSNAKTKRAEFQQQLELQQAGLDAQALEIATEKEKQVMKDALEAAQTGFVLNAETGQYVKDPNFTAPEDYDFSMQTDDQGNVTQIRTNKNTGEVITTELGSIGKGSSTKFQSQFNPITGEQVIFDPVTGKNIGRETSTGEINYNITDVNPEGSTNVAQYSQIYMGSPANAEGVDLAGQKGSPIKSNVSGEVIFAGDAGGWGNQVRIKDENGNVHQFSHLDSIQVNQGDTVNADALLGGMGNTGNVMAGDGSELTEEQIAQGRGTHLDYTVYNDQGGKYTVGEAVNFLGLNRGDAPLAEKEVLELAQDADIDVTDPKESARILATYDKYGVLPKKILSVQEKAARGFANRVNDAGVIMDDVYANIDNQEELLKLRNLPSLGGVTGALKPAWFKQAEQAERNFVNALLRRESGAAIAPEEFSSAALQYFPMPYDDPQTLENKKDNRETAIRNLMFEGGYAEGADAGVQVATPKITSQDQADWESL